MKGKVRLNFTRISKLSGLKSPIPLHIANIPESESIWFKLRQNFCSRNRMVCSKTQSNCTNITWLVHNLRHIMRNIHERSKSEPKRQKC